MSTCSRCGAQFGCAMADGSDAPCWCTELPPVVPVPGEAAACWCRACLTQHIAEQGIGAAIVPPHDGRSQVDPPIGPVKIISE